MVKFNELIKYNNVFASQSELLEIYKILTSPNWEFTGKSISGSNKIFWYMNLKDSEFFNNYFVEAVEKLTRKKFSVISIYANGQTYGLDSDFHVDTMKENAYTFLYYANTEWYKHWGGETVFDMGDKLEYVYPLPNSAVFFQSNIYHYAKSPSRDCPLLRTTIALKLQLL